MALFADDLLLFVTQTHISIPAIFQEFQRFGEVSNFKVNYNKSKLLDICLYKTTMTRLTINFSFHDPFFLYPLFRDSDDSLGMTIVLFEISSNTSKNLDGLGLLYF